MRPTTRRRLRLLAAPALALTLLAAACSGDDDDGASTSGTGEGNGEAAIELPDCPVDALESTTEPVDVLVWYALSAKTEATLLAQIDTYNASQDKVVVRAESQGASYEELLRKYEASIESGDLPDLAVMEDTTMQFMADSGTVLPAQACYDADGLSTDQFVQTAVDYYSIGGALYPASANLSDILTYYNKNHFRKAGLDPDKPPATLDEVRQYAEQIKAAGVVDTPVVLKLDSWFIETQLTGSDQPVVDNDNGRGGGQTTAAVFDDPATLELLQWLKDMNDAGLLEPVTATDGQVDHYLAMAGQKGSITIETSTAATSVEAFLGGDASVVEGDTSDIDLEALDFGAGPVFGVDEAGQAQVGGGAWFIIDDPTVDDAAEDAKQAGAWDFMKWWNQVDQLVVWHLVGSYLRFLLVAADDPRILVFWTGDLAGQWLGIAYEEMLNGVNPDFPGPLIGPYDQFRENLRGAMDEVVFSGADPQQALTAANDATTDAITTYNDINF